MPIKTSIETTPPGFGWGEEEDPINWRLYKERRLQEINSENGAYIPCNDALLARGDKTAMERLIESEMPYDDGFDLDVVDKLMIGSPSWVHQANVGSCVGAGGGSAWGTRSCVEILLEGDFESPFGLQVHQFKDIRDLAVPNIDFHYGCGKMKRYYDGSRFTTSRRLGDGSYCSVQIWAFQECGALPCGEVQGNFVFPQTKNIRSHAGNNDNFLNKHLEVGKKYRMGRSVEVNSADDLKKVIVELKEPCMICSGWGFGPSHKVDGLGWVYRRSGSWPHNMTLVAFVEYKGKWYVKVRNSWGSGAHRDGWHFFIPVELFESWIRQASCQSIGELNLKKALPSFPV